MEQGAAVIEHLVLLFTFLIFLIAVVTVLFRDRARQLFDKPLLIAAVVALIGGISWAGKEALSGMYRRIQFLILEYLSDYEPHDRQEILSALRKRVFVSIYKDALAELVLEGKVTIEKGKYRLADRHKSP